MEITSQITRKSLHTQILEAAARKDVTVRTTNLADGRLAYILTQHGIELLPVTPGEAAGMLEIVWP